VFHRPWCDLVVVDAAAAAIDATIAAIQTQVAAEVKN